MSDMLRHSLVVGLYLDKPGKNLRARSALPGNEFASVRRNDGKRINERRSAEQESFHVAPSFCGYLTIRARLFGQLVCGIVVLDIGGNGENVDRHGYFLDGSFSRYRTYIF
ncbi:hypothetical protein V1478_008875 [Vespula squamosa]|uniref:Uncharacterized protein n=1 Tax=Vespula squamosa TaxID=30214 RepID=A0ABD2AUR2_VESSQ